MPNDKNAIPTILRGLVVVEKIAEAKRAISAAELIEELGLPKPSIHRILQQLEEEGLVQRDPVSRRFMPGMRTQSLAFNVASHKALSAPRHAILQALSDDIEETCNCTMLDGDRIIYFDRVEANWPYRIQLPVGSRLPLHCTASGKLFLSHMGSRQRNRLINAAPLARYTERTITDPELLQEDLKRISDEGIGIDNEENLAGMVALAVPVLSSKNEIYFTIAVHAPKIRKTLEELRQYIPRIKSAAAAMAESYHEPEEA